MAEYTVPSQRFHDFKRSKFRTAEWVSTVSESEFYSPSAPRSEISDDDGLSEVSDVESSHSTPPRLMLRYGDGRPDVPIPHVHDISPNKDSVSRSQTFPQDRYHRSGPSVHNQSRSRGHEMAISSVPEEILIYPSEGTRNGSLHTRSKSLPRNAYHNQDSDGVPSLSLPPPQIVSEPLYSPGFIPQQPDPPHSGHHISFSHTQPAHWRGRTGSSPHHHQPPVIYTNHSRHAHYQQPPIYSHPHKIGPNGMIYSHSAPVPNTHYPPMGATPYPSAIAPSAQSTGDHRGRTRSRTRGSDRHNESTASISSRSGESGSTYYVVPTGRQKSHALVSLLPFDSLL